MHDQHLGLSRSLAELSQEDSDTFLYTSYRKRNSIQGVRRGEWSHSENVLLVASQSKQPTSRDRMIESLKKRSELPRLSFGSVSQLTMVKHGGDLKLQSLYMQSKIKPLSLNLVLPKEKPNSEKEAQAKFTLSVERMISNNHLRRRFRREQANDHNAYASNFKVRRARDHSRDLQLNSHPKPINPRQTDMQAKIAEFRKALRMKKRVEIEDFIEYDFPINY